MLIVLKFHLQKSQTTVSKLRSGCTSKHYGVTLITDDLSMMTKLPSIIMQAGPEFVQQTMIAKKSSSSVYHRKLGKMILSLIYI